MGKRRPAQQTLQRPMTLGTGEGDGSLAFWQRAHTAFFGRKCQRLGREFNPAAPVVCERFEVVFRSGSQTAGS